MTIIISGIQNERGSLLLDHNDYDDTLTVDLLLEMALASAGIPLSACTNLYLRTVSGHQLTASALSAATATPRTDIFLQIGCRIIGGKGGFGANLRRQGSKMGKNTTNFEACRDLSGRRIRTLNDAKRLAEAAEMAAKLEKEKQKRIAKKIEDGLNPKVKKVVFDDSEFNKVKEKSIGDIKDAVSAAIGSASSSSSAAPKIATKKFSWVDDDDEDSDDSDVEALKTPGKQPLKA